MNSGSRLIFALAALALVAPASGAAKRALTHEDMWLMRRIAPPVVSPDGEWVLAAVVDPAYDPKDEVIDLWIMRADGALTPKRLTNSKPAEASAAWSPDSRKIAYVFRPENEPAPQVYVADIEAGVINRITNLTTGARTPHWSPDGKSIAFVSEVFPGTRSDRDNEEIFRARRESKSSARVYDGFPIRHWDRWLDERRPHLFVLEVGSDAPPRDLFADWEPAQLQSFGGRITDTIETLDFCWAPDGKEIVFAATLDRDKAAHSVVATDLFSIALDGSPPRRLTGDGRSYFEPVFSPDGKWFVACATAENSGKVFTETRLVRFPWPFNAAKAVSLAEGFGRSPRQPVVPDSGGFIYFTAEDAGHERVYRAPASGGPASLFCDPKDGVLTSLSVGGPRSPVFAVVTDAAHRPPEVALISPKGRLRRLTAFNVDRAREFDLRPVEEFWFTSGKGRRIHNLLVRPAGFDPARKYPVLVLVHGGPHSMARDSFSVRWNYHLFAGTEYVVLATNYSGSTGFGEAFGQGTQGDPLKTPGDEILEAIDAAVARYSFLDGNRVSAAGASYGAHLVNWLQATSTRFRCLVSHAGMVNVASQWGTSDIIFHRELNMEGPVWSESEIWTTQNPARFAHRNATGDGWVTPMLLSAGERDYRVPVNNSLETWSYLKRLEIPSRLIVFPDENHWIQRGENNRFWYAEVKAWLDKWTLPLEKPAG